MITIHWDINSAFNSLSDISPLLIYHNILLLYVWLLLQSPSIIRIFLCLLLSLYYALSSSSLPKKSSLLIKKKGKSWRSGINFPLPLPTYNYIYWILKFYEMFSSSFFIIRNIFPTTIVDTTTIIKWSIPTIKANRQTQNHHQVSSYLDLNISTWFAVTFWLRCISPPPTLSIISLMLN